VQHLHRVNEVCYAREIVALLLSRFARAASAHHPRALARLIQVPAFTACLAGVLLAGCATAPQKSNEPPPPSYDSLLDTGAQEMKAGHKDQAIAAWAQAAKQNPAAKEPWLRMAQTHFDAGEYGSAISEAQEALQRDNTDEVANGLLAVSGLRVSSQALARMRTKELAGTTRGEAETLAKTLRELLGTPVLVPPPENVAQPARPVRHAARHAAAASAASAAAATPAAANTKPAAKASASSNDPFSALR
jgi:tetratricopeptide (TPR) repeat protein